MITTVLIHRKKRRINKTVSKTFKATKTLILSSNNTQFGSCQPRLLNDLDVDGDAIYFVDTSYLRSAAEALQEIGEAQPRGRLFKFTQSTSKVELLLDNL